MYFQALQIYLPHLLSSATGSCGYPLNKVQSREASGQKKFQETRERLFLCIKFGFCLYSDIKTPPGRGCAVEWKVFPTAAEEMARRLGYAWEAAGHVEEAAEIRKGNFEKKITPRGACKRKEIIII